MILDKLFILKTFFKLFKLEIYLKLIILIQCLQLYSL